MPPRQSAGDAGINNIGDNSGVINTGTIVHGMTIEEHERLLAAEIKRLEEKNATLVASIEEAHALREELSAVTLKALRRELDEANEKLAEVRRRADNPAESLQEMQARMVELERLLASSSAEVSENRLKSAFEAMAKGDFSYADKIFAEIREGEERAVERYAEAAFGQGLIAEQEVRWSNAADHFAKAASLSETSKNLRKAGTFLWRAGRYREAISHDERRIALLEKGSDSDPIELADAFASLAGNFLTLGKFPAAEELQGKALSVLTSRNRQNSPEFVFGLARLARIYVLTNRMSQAEPILARIIHENGVSCRRAWCKRLISRMNLSPNTFHAPQAEFPARHARRYPDPARPVTCLRPRCSGQVRRWRDDVEWRSAAAA